MFLFNMSIKKRNTWFRYFVGKFSTILPIYSSLSKYFTVRVVIWIGALKNYSMSSPYKTILRFINKR